jgi:hypothetical protein
MKRGRLGASSQQRTWPQYLVAALLVTAVTGALVPAAASRQVETSVLDGLEDVFRVSETAEAEPIAGHSGQAEINDDATFVVFAAQKSSPTSGNGWDSRPWEDLIDQLPVFGDTSIDLTPIGGETEVWGRDLETDGLEGISEAYWATSARASSNWAHEAFSPTVTADGGRVMFVQAWLEPTIIGIRGAAQVAGSTRYTIVEWDRVTGTGVELVPATRDPLSHVTVSGDGSMLAWQRLSRAPAASRVGCASAPTGAGNPVVELLDRSTDSSATHVAPCAAEPDLSADGGHLALTRLEASLQVEIFETPLIDSAPVLSLPTSTNTQWVQPSLSADGRIVAATAIITGASRFSGTFVVPDFSVLGIAAQSAVQPQRTIRVVVFDRDSDGDGTLDNQTLEAKAAVPPLAEAGVSDSPDLSADGSLLGFTAISTLTGGDQDPELIDVTTALFLASAELLGADGAAIRRGAAQALVVEVEDPESSIGLLSRRPGEAVVAHGGGVVDLAGGINGLVFHAIDDGKSPGPASDPADGQIDVYARIRGAALELAPSLVDFGGLDLAGPPEDRAITLRSTGARAAEIATAAISPSDAGFEIRSSTCSGITLEVDLTCQIVVRFTPSAEGEAAATLAVSALVPDEEHTALLRAKVIDPTDPQLEIDPVAAPGGFVPVVTGTGFTPGQTIIVQWADGSGVEPATVISTTATGTFEIDILVFPNSLTGERELEVIVGGILVGDVAEGGASVAQVDYLVTLNTYDPAELGRG